MDKRLLGEVRLARFAFVATVLLSLLGGLLIIVQAGLLSRIISRAFLEGVGRSELRGLFALLLATVGLRALNQACARVAANGVTVRVKDELRRRVVERLLQLGPAYTERERSGELALAVTDGVEALDSFFREYLPALFTAALVPLAILLVVLPIDWLTFFVLLLTAPLIPIFMMLIGRAAGALARSRYAQLGQMSAHFLDVMQGLTTLKLFNRSRAQAQIIARISDRYRRSTLAVLRVAFLSAFALELLATISVALVAVEIGLRLLYGRLAFEQALFLLVVAPEFYMPLRQLGAKFHAGRDGAAAAERIYGILSVPQPQMDGGAPVPAYDHIQFDNVSVSYGPGRPALRDFSLTIRRGEHIALVGASGSGKSTVASLLLRFAPPDKGRVFLGNGAERVALRDVDTGAWRAQMAWAPQRGYLFNVSVADNIRLGAGRGRPEVTEAQVASAARAARADGFIRRLPQGYDTVPGENAARLSGGQAQRVALARAFAHPASLYIFDEATASLDAENEAAIQEALKALTPEATVLTIAHRLHTVRHADRIVVLDGGRIVESGSHEALVARRGAYFELLQIAGEGAHV